MKIKFMIIFVLCTFFFFISYGNNDVYKDKLTQKLLKHMNAKLDDLESKWKIKKDEIIPKFKKDLTKLRDDNYKKTDFEYDVIQELMNNLRLENTQEKSDKNPSSSKKPEEKSQESQPQEQTSDQIQPRGPSIKIDENAPESSKELTQEQKEQIQWYIEQLKQEEKNNIHLNKPREQQDIFDILRDDFMFEWMKQNQSGW